LADRLYDRREMLKVMARTGVCVAAMIVVGCGGGENVLLKEKDLVGNGESTDVPP
jgi:hypothetical protein